MQPVSKQVEQVHYFGGWVEGAKSLWCQGFADRQPYRTGGGFRCIKVGTKVCKTQQTDTQTDENTNRSGGASRQTPVKFLPDRQTYKQIYRQTEKKKEKFEKF